jgi:hypothetical protein
MKNPRTTLAGIIGLLATCAAHYVLSLPAPVVTIVGSVASAVVGVLAADGKKTE